MRNIERLPSEQELTRLREGWPGRGWTWDSRHSCVVSSFSVTSEDDYQSIIVKNFPIRWTHKTIAKAPSPLQRLLADLAGVRDGQLVYTPENCRDDFACVLWWPWGDDVNISARVALTDRSEATLEIFRDAFHIVEV